MVATEKETEKDWIARSLQGDPDAFASLITKYQRMIHALTYRMTGCLAESEDLAQETFLQAHRQLATFRSEAHFSSWLYRIAVNLCLNWRKRHQRREQVYEQWQQSSEIACEPDSSISQEVQNAMMRLPAKQRAAVTLTIYDGLSHAEAARVLGCSETTVSWRMFAAKRKLKSFLKHVQTGGDL